MFDTRRTGRKRQTTEITFPAPTRGWIQSGNITTAPLDAAEVLENFFPTAQGARLRGGSSSYANIGSAIGRMFVHSTSTDELFAATSDGIYDATRINGGGAVFADVAGLTSSDWASVQVSTGGGIYTLAVNGSDYMQRWDGTDWNPVTTVALNNLGYDALVTQFTVGETITGGTSGATATVYGIHQSSATAGTLRLGTITGGPFVDNETLTGGTSGSATANGGSSSGSTVAITGVATTGLSQLWLFKTRVFAIEKNSLSAWYLPVNSIGGAASELDMGPIFRKGGYLSFGATWSIDSGNGIDDVCIFVTTNGEIAVYQGTDPSSSSTWALVGVYEISRPLNKHAWFKAGGDLAILCEDGIIPVSEALKKDRAALQAVAITYPIETAWKSAVSNRTTSYPITPTLWQSQALLMLGIGSSTTYIANARTGAWAVYTGWDVRCGAVANDKLYFGTNGGYVLRGQYGGTDNGANYTGKYVPKFTEGGIAGLKMANHAGITAKASESPVFRMACFADYKVGTYPVPGALNTTSASAWGTGVWGTFVWGGGLDENTYTVWKSVAATGYSLAPVVVVTSTQSETPIFEILATRLRFEVAGSL